MKGALLRSGTTLVELAVVLGILAVSIALAVPPLGRGLDRHAAWRARDALVAGIARTRAMAVARGGAVLVVDVAAGRFWIETPGGQRVGDPVDLWREYGVRLAVDGGREARLSLRFDGLGIARMANRTLRVVRGGAEAGVTLSAYGRVRRW